MYERSVNGLGRLSASKCCSLSMFSQTSTLYVLSTVQMLWNHRRDSIFPPVMPIASTGSLVKSLNTCTSSSSRKLFRRATSQIERPILEACLDLPPPPPVAFASRCCSRSFFCLDTRPLTYLLRQSRHSRPNSSRRPGCWPDSPRTRCRRRCDRLLPFFRGLKKKKKRDGHRGRGRGGE